MKHALRAASAVVKLALMSAFVGALAVVPVLAVVTALVVLVMAGGAWRVGAGIIVLGLLAAAGVGLLAARRGRLKPFVGVPISSDEQPLLWVEVYRVAEGLGTRPPDELSLVPDANVAASEHRTWLGLRPGVRRLDLGLPLLAGLTERQLRALITHDFCHRWGPASIERGIHRGKAIIGWLVGRVAEDSRAGRILGRYGDLYLVVSGPVSRRHELEVDRLSAGLAGKDATAAALREVAVLRRGWDAFVSGYTEPAAAVGRRPHDVFAGFASFLEEPNRRAELAQEVAESSSEQWTAYGSQLSLEDRLAAIESLPEDEMHDRSGPAMDLLRDPDQMMFRVEEFMFRESGFIPASWEDIVPEAGRAAACEDALQLARLAHEGGLGPTLSVATLLEVISLGLADEMVRPMLAEGSSPAAERQLAGRLVTGFLATAAIECGTASYRFSWAAARLLVDEQGVVDDLPGLVDTAIAHPGEVPALELWLESHCVGQDLELGADLGQAVREGMPGAQAQTPGEGFLEDPRPLMVPVPGTGAT